MCIKLQVLLPNVQFGDVLKLLLCIKTLLGTFSIVFVAPQAKFLTFSMEFIWELTYLGVQTNAM